MPLSQKLYRVLLFIAAIVLPANESPVRTFFVQAASVLTMARLMDGTTPTSLVIFTIVTILYGYFLAWRDTDLQRVVASGRQCIHHVVAAARTTGNVIDKDDPHPLVYSTGHAFTPVACWAGLILTVLGTGALMDAALSANGGANIVLVMALVLALLATLAELARAATVFQSTEAAFLTALVGHATATELVLKTPPLFEWGFFRGYQHFALMPRPTGSFHLDDQHGLL